MVAVNVKPVVLVVVLVVAAVGTVAEMVVARLEITETVRPTETAVLAVLPFAAIATL